MSNSEDVFSECLGLMLPFDSNGDTYHQASVRFGWLCHGRARPLIFCHLLSIKDEKTGLQFFGSVSFMNSAR